MKLLLEIVIAVLILGRLAWDEAVIWYAETTNCDCKHEAGCPFYDEEE